MAITLRSNSSPLATTKNSPLSHDEMDANFTSSVFLFGNQGISGSKTFSSTDGVTTFYTSASFNNGFTVNANSVVTGSLSVGFTDPATTVVGRIDAANDVVVFSTSDERLKSNISSIEDPLEKISSIRGVKFDWIEEPSLQKLHGFIGTDIGVIAQEVEAVLPEIVTDKFTGYKGVKYDKLIPLLIEAIKELNSKVQDLEDRLAGG